VTLAVLRLHRNRLLALILTGVVGLLLSAAFAWFSAPDLALTQLTVEVVTVLLMLLALNFLPATTPSEISLPRRLRDGAIAGVAAAGAGALAYALMIRDAAFPVISEFHWAESKPGAGGTNAVNTIIVDFRGYDTFGEIIVLGIAAIVIFALAETVLKSPQACDRLAALDLRGNAGDPHPAMLVIGTRFLMPVALLVGVYLFLRGHNLPGGGFVAGLIFAIALLLQYVASGFVWSDRRLHLDPHALIGAGVLVASAAGIGAFVFGLPFLTSGYDYVTLPGFATFELATAAIFDLGVFLCVLGAVVLALATLSRLAQKTSDRGV
jgi:multicomponent K+:H+ antiporter subunit A